MAKASNNNTDGKSNKIFDTFFKPKKKIGKYFWQKNVLLLVIISHIGTTRTKG